MFAKVGSSAITLGYFEAKGIFEKPLLHHPSIPHLTLQLCLILESAAFFGRGFCADRREIARAPFD